MHRASSSMGAIAGALAKAQAELVNPEKTLTASIRAPSAPNGEQTFRYASLSSGLEIVRKCLGKHEIAAIQSTAIDHDARMVKLVTVLAHSSGEWVASDWPVCPISEMGSPQRMGAALTYARRYALFTLVGIAGEDDLDAPDATGVSASIDEVGPALIQSSSHGGKAGSNLSSAVARARPVSPTAPVLSDEKSAAKRDELIAELNTLSSSEELDSWAHRSLPIKNTLTVADAGKLEEAFQTRAIAAADDPIPLSTTDHKERRERSSRDARIRSNVGRRAPKVPASSARPQVKQLAAQRGTNQVEGAEGIDKSVLTIATVKRRRNKAHLRLVAQGACLVCGRQPCDAHHLRFAQPRGLGLKVSDEFTVPLCRIHHREVHQHAKELEWWKALNIDPLPVAASLWQTSIGATQERQRQGRPNSRTLGCDDRSNCQRLDPSSLLGSFSGHRQRASLGPQ